MSALCQKQTFCAAVKSRYPITSSAIENNRLVALSLTAPVVAGETKGSAFPLKFSSPNPDAGRAGQHEEGRGIRNHAVYALLGVKCPKFLPVMAHITVDVL